MSADGPAFDDVLASAFHGWELISLAEELEPGLHARLPSAGEPTARIAAALLLELNAADVVRLRELAAARRPGRRDELLRANLQGTRRSNTNSLTSPRIVNNDGIVIAGGHIETLNVDLRKTRRS